MDVVSWIVLGAVIVLSAVGLMLWNRFFKRSSPIDRLDPDAAEEVLEVQAKYERGDMGGGRGTIPF